jgi:hydrogenase-4 membrane subunit HyfE
LGNICVIIHHISILFGKHSYLLLSIIDIVPKAKVLTILFTKAIFSDL